MRVLSGTLKIVDEHHKMEDPVLEYFFPEKGKNNAYPLKDA